MRPLDHYYATWMEDNQGITLTKEKKDLRLLSYYFISSSKRENSLRRYFTTGVFGSTEELIEFIMLKIFIDSGAFSALTKGVTINLKDYAAFLNKYKALIKVYANLDVIGDPEATYNNQKEMEKMGLNPVPCFHQGENISKYLLRYLNEGYKYIALGGMVGTRKENLMPWLNDCFKHICDSNGVPRVKVHGFGLTSLELLKRYPWYSVDSTSWVRTSRMGMVMVPYIDEETGKYDYLKDPMKVGMSRQSSALKEIRAHYLKLSDTDYLKRDIENYSKHIGVPIGKSDYHLEKVNEYSFNNDEDRSLFVIPDFFLDEKAETWKLIKGVESYDDLKEKMGTHQYRIIETIIERGAANDYTFRDSWSLKYNDGMVGGINDLRAPLHTTLEIKGVKKLA